MAGDSESDNISTSTSGSDAVTSLSSDAVSDVKRRNIHVWPHCHHNPWILLQESEGSLKDYTAASRRNTAHTCATQQTQQRTQPQQPSYVDALTGNKSSQDVRMQEDHKRSSPARTKSAPTEKVGELRSATNSRHKSPSARSVTSSNMKPAKNSSVPLNPESNGSQHKYDGPPSVSATANGVSVGGGEGGVMATSPRSQPFLNRFAGKKQHQHHQQQQHSRNMSHKRRKSATPHYNSSRAAHALSPHHTHSSQRSSQSQTNVNNAAAAASSKGSNAR